MFFKKRRRVCANVSKRYLRELMVSVNDLCDKTKYKEIDMTGCSFSFMATKKVTFIGLREGYSEQIVRNDKKIKEVPKVRSDCQNYNKIIRDASGKVIQIENFINGRLDVLYQVHWDGKTCYRFPYSSDGYPYPTYTCVTRWENSKVVEEYFVEEGQIVYECYYDESYRQAKHYYIDYVPEGQYPVLGERKGIFKFNPLVYECLESHYWWSEMDE